MKEKYFEETKNYYLGLLSDNVKDLTATRKTLKRNIDDLTLISDFIENGDLLDYEDYSLFRLAEAVGTLVSCSDFLWSVANNIDCFLDFLDNNSHCLAFIEEIMEGENEND